MTSIALVTGASAGFGAAIARQLVAKGYQVIGVARREQRLQALQSELGAAFQPLTLDITDRAAVKQACDGLAARQTHVDLLVNNAGLALGRGPAQQADLDDWERMVATNVLGLLRLTHALLPDMVRRNQGHIINIGSTAGNYAYPGGNVYGATKAFIKQFSLGLRADLFGTNVRVTNLEPGMVGGTEFSQVRFHGDGDKAAAIYAGTEPLKAEDVAEAVVWAASQPAHVNVNIIEMMPVVQSLAGTRVFRPNESKSAQ